MKRLFLAGVTCMVFASGAYADPTIYGFEGYISNRDVQTPPLPQGFTIGTRITGTFTFDPTHKVYDSETQAYRVTPILKWEAVAENGDKLASQDSYGSLSVQRDASGETLHAENLFGLGIQWHSNEVGQLPADVSNVDLSALDPNHWDAQITQAPDCYPDFCSEELMSDIGFHITSLWRKGPAANVTVSQFTNGAPGWTVQSGQWAASNGYYRNSSNLEASIATAPATTEDRYAIDAKLYLEWSAAGNQGGLVYDFVDSRNYRGVLLSPGKKNADGSFRNASIQVLEVRNGVRKVVARRDQIIAYAQQWLNARVERIGTQTYASVGGWDIRLDQAVQTGAKRAGLLASYNLVRFDDVVVGVTPRQ